MSTAAHLAKNPKQLVFIDAMGALVSALGLGLIHHFFPEFFGLPKGYIPFLLLFSIAYFIVDIWQWRTNKELFGYLRILAHLNAGYGLLTFGLILYFRTTISAYGAMYFLIESYLLILLAHLQWSIGKHRSETLPSSWTSLGWVIPSIAFVAYKIPDLQLAYYWDEAWSYFPAVKAMAEAGPSLLPNTIEPVLYRGHPTFFYWLGGVSMNLIGGGIPLVKVLAKECLLRGLIFPYEELHKSRATAWILPANHPSSRLFEGLGFELEEDGELLKYFRNLPV